MGRFALRTWAGVNGGVLGCAVLSHATSLLVRGARRDGGATWAAAACGTAVLYIAVYLAAHLNLRGRKRARASGREATNAPSPLSISFWSVLWHPLGSACERIAHERYLTSAARLPCWLPAAAPATALAPLLPPLASHALLYVLWMSLRLFAFEVVFDGLFYTAHRLVHAHPRVYQLVHKLHHRHTHDVWLLSSLQMSAPDVLLTHTLPVLGALALVRFEPGLELCVAKTYLLFQELYGHAGVEHRGRNFGPAPGLVQALGIELRAEDHQQHHIQAACNFSKRFSLFDRFFGTYVPAASARAKSPSEPRPRRTSPSSVAEALMGFDAAAAIK